MNDGIEIGGPIAVDTEAMLRAASVLGDARAGLQHLAARARSAAVASSALLAGHLHEAADLLAAAERQADLAGDGLRLAALRYGWTERAVAEGQQMVAAGLSAVEGSLVRTVGPVPVLGADAVVSGGFVLGQVLDQWTRTGRVAPQSDPEVVRWLQLRLSSLDDALRGLLGVETPRDVAVDDPASAFGTRTIGAAIAAVLWPAAHPVAVRRTTSAAADRPTSIAELADRLPDGAQPEGQVRIERYDDADGPRWIVYSAGTVTFDVDSGREPFDLESDVRGVAGTRADAQDAVLDAMRRAGVGPDDPVLMVGHSQGALNVLRIAERGDYAVDGVVEFGGPTEQIPAPDGTAVLQVVHAQDLVPALGGVAAVAGAGTVRVRRTLPEARTLPAAACTGSAIDAFPAHDMRQYRETVARAESLRAPRVVALRERWSAFFEGGPGTATRYRADRQAPPAVSAPDRCR